jgi:hypothetical protein
MKTITKSILAFTLGMAFNFNSIAQTNVVATFDDLTLPTDSFWDGSDLSGQFINSGIIFNNSYDFGFWLAGFVYSNMVDDTTEGYTNPFSTFAGSGALGSNNFALQNGTRNIIKFQNSDTKTFRAEGFYITNSTYAALSMLNGDFVGKVFGSPLNANGIDDGTNGEDYFFTTIFGYKNGIKSTDSVDFYLADYRDVNNQYIVDSWEWVDLSSLGLVDSIEFVLRSSDNDVQFGMNTPGIFCIDNFTIIDETGVSDNLNLSNSDIQIYPNPASEVLFVNFENKNISNGELVVFDFIGNEIYRQSIANSINRIDLNISAFSKGNYFVQIVGDNTFFNQKLIVK